MALQVIKDVRRIEATNSLTEEQKSGIVTTVLNDSKTLSDPDSIEG